LEDNSLPPQTGDGTETNDSGLPDDLRNERVNDPTKDKDDKAAIMKAVKKKNPNFSKEQVIAETNRILKGI